MTTLTTYRVPAWQALGPTFSEGLTASAAVLEAGLNYEIRKRPIYVDVDGDRVALDEVALVRDHTVLATVSRSFGVIQNVELARALDPLTRIYPVRAAGSKDSGGFVYFVLEGEETEIASDKIRSCFLISDSKGAGRALSMTYAPLHLATTSVLIPGGADGSVSLSMVHRKTISKDLTLSASVFPQLERARERMLGTFRKMAEHRLTDKEVDEILAAAFPEPARPKKAALRDELQAIGATDEATLDRLGAISDKHEYYANRSYVYRDEVRNKYELSGHGTAWSLWVLVCEDQDYRRGRDTIPESALFGLRAKAKMRAFDVASSV